ncbi:FMN-linked oxidoreductase [Biscogniauxia mediterranea]|nr:FMN-linked oxidoreductase [Biscogniauxia mediterranea]
MAYSQRILHRTLFTSGASPVARSRNVPSRILPQISRRATSSSSSSSSSASSSSPRKAAASSKALLYTTALAVSGCLVYVYATDTRAFVHRYIVPRLLRVVYPDAEQAHDAAVQSMKILYSLNLHPRERVSPSAAAAGPDISVTVFGEQLANPLGISAGLDKHAEIPDALFALGPAVVEVGGCTPLPQEGNPRPRMFRVPTLDGLINRYGLNSHGADDMAMRLQQRVRRFAKSVGLHEDDVLDGAAGVPPGSLLPGRMLLVQIAKNKETDERNVDAVKADYVYCVRRLGRYADVLVVNVSSPNTPGLRDLQAVEPLTRILSAVVDEARKTDRTVKPKVMVKVSPDEDEDTQMDGIVQAVWSSGVDGVIVGNTTKRRTGLVPPGVKMTPTEQLTMTETGGYSGPMMFDRTVDLVRRYRKMLDDRSLQSVEEKVVADEAVDTSIAALDGTITSPPKEGIKSQVKPSERKPQEQKAIFATGGITNGKQALEVLNAGASVAMVYTALVYGGAGTITRMKSEMKEDLSGKKGKEIEE